MRLVHALPPAYTLARGEIVADAGDERAHVKVDCATPLAIAVRGSDVLVACGDEMLLYTTAADVMRPALVERRAIKCIEFVNGVCRAPYEVISLDEDKLQVATPSSSWSSESYVVRRERRTALGGAIIAASLGTALVAGIYGWILDAGSLLCASSTCGTPHDVGVGLEVGSIITAVVGTISGIAVAATWHDVKRRTTTIIPSVQVAAGGGMIGLRMKF
jgi:hypothetical protein